MKHLRTIRIILALLFFVGTTLLFLDFSGVLQHCLGWMAKVQFLPALLSLNVAVVVVLLLVTLLFGRCYCSVICPMGVMQDCFTHVGGWFRKNRFHYVKNHPWLRWIVFGLFALLIVLGITSIAALIAPYSTFGRIVQNLFQPVYLWGNNILADIAEKHESVAFHHVVVWIRSAAVFAIALVTFLLLVVLSLFWGRAWCNNICPVGTLLGFVSRVSLFRPAIDSSKCVSCRKCEHNCKAQCIDISNHIIDASRCVDCFDCINNCKFNALIYRKVGFRTKMMLDENILQTSENAISSASRTEASRDTKQGALPTSPSALQTEEIDEGKRKFLVTTALVAGAATVNAQAKRMDGGLAVLVDKKVPTRKVALKPAGSISLQHFSSHCTACQLCVAGCPNGVLRPSSSLSTLMQPEMSYERGYCRPECTRCSEVCPTGAIHLVTPSEKSSIHIGKAVWISDNCVVNTDSVNCGHCASHCPAGAILLVSKDPGNPASLKIPSVDESRCIGCGACENLCPARPFSAIYVEGREEHVIM